MKKLLCAIFLVASLASAQTSANITVNGIANQSYANGPQILNAIPTPPQNAQLYANIQAQTGWIACAQSCAGGGNGITSFTQGITSPSLSNNALQVSVASQHSIATITVAAGGSGYVVNDVITVSQSGASGGQATVAAVTSGAVTSLTLATAGSGTDYAVANALPTTGGTGTGLTVNITAITGSANSLFYNKTLGCPTKIPGGCAATADIHILEDYYIYIPSTDTGIQAIENDPDLYDGASEYFNSRQCDSATGDWRLWNMGSNSWIATPYPCAMLTTRNQWIHMREYTVISRGLAQSYYEAFEYAGSTVWYNLNQAFPPKTLASGAAMNFEVQLDLNATAGTATQSFYVDDMNAWVW